jgi:hypothetical protein
MHRAAQVTKICASRGHNGKKKEEANVKNAYKPTRSKKIDAARGGDDEKTGGGEF